MYIIYNFSLKLIRKKIIAIFNKQINVDLKVDLDAVSIKKTIANFKVPIKQNYDNENRKLNLKTCFIVKWFRPPPPTYWYENIKYIIFQGRKKDILINAKSMAFSDLKSGMIDG